MVGEILESGIGISGRSRSDGLIEIILPSFFIFFHVFHWEKYDKTQNLGLFPVDLLFCAARAPDGFRQFL